MVEHFSKWCNFALRRSWELRLHIWAYLLEYIFWFHFYEKIFSIFREIYFWKKKFLSWTYEKNDFKGVGSSSKSRLFSLREGSVWKYLLNRSEDAKNGFFTKFYIDLVTRKISQLFFSMTKIIILKFWKNIFLKMWKNIFQIFPFCDFDFFHLNFFYNRCFFEIFQIFKNDFFQNFQRYFFHRKKSWKKSNHYIVVNFPEESIFRMLRMIRAVWGAQIWLWS